MMKIKSIILYVNEFGLKIFLSKAIRKLLYNSDSKFAWMINRDNEKNIKQFLKKEFESSEKINFYCERINNNVEENPVWVLWLQGEENAPEVVKLCIKNIQCYCGSHRVYVLSEKNIKQYVSMPDYIWEKYEKGCIGNAHMADMIRLNLLYLYGGLWIDSTVYVSQSIPEIFFNRKFYTIHFGKNTKDPSHGRWTTFLISSKKENEFIKKILEYHWIYWKKHNQIIDYIMFDYIIQYLIETDKDCYEQIAGVNINNERVFELKTIMNHIYEAEIYNELIQGTVFHKLSRKQNYEKELNNQVTIYGYLVEMAQQYNLNK